MLWILEPELPFTHIRGNNQEYLQVTFRNAAPVSESLFYALFVLCVSPDVVLAGPGYFRLDTELPAHWVLPVREEVWNALHRHPRTAVPQEMETPARGGDSAGKPAQADHSQEQRSDESGTGNKRGVVRRAGSDDPQRFLINPCCRRSRVQSFIGNSL